MNIYQLLLILFIQSSGIFSCNRSKKPEPYSKYVLNEDLKQYRSQHDLLRKEFGGTYTMPDFSFYLFGMGNRNKYLYKKEKLIPNPYPIILYIKSLGEGMRIISSDFVDKKIAAPHIWHAAEVFLYLYEFK